MSTRRECGRMGGGTKLSQKWVLNTINLWAARLNLKEWQIGVSFKDHTPKNGTIVTVLTAPSHEGFRDAEITVYVPALASLSEAKRVKKLIHELRHLHYDQLRNRIDHQVGLAGAVGSKLNAEIELLCERDAEFFYRQYSRKKKSADERK